MKRNKIFSPCALRRTATRLRSGELVPADAEVLQIADQIEQDAARQELLVSVIVMGREVFSTKKEEEAKRRRRAATLLRLKQSPEASDPDSAVAKRIRRVQRLRRQEHGRVRGRRRK